MGARASRPAAKLTVEEARILAQSQTANNAARRYKAGWWASKSNNPNNKTAKNAARAKLSQLQLREKQRELKDKLAQAKLDLDDAKSDFQEAKKVAAKSGAGQNNRNARNDAEDEVDELEDKIHDIEKELRSIRKFISYKDKTYKAFKPVKVAAGMAAKAVLVNAPRLLGAAALKAAVAAYNAGTNAYRASRKGLLAAHYRAVIGMLEYDLERGRNSNTGKMLSNTNKANKRKELADAKAGLERLMKGDTITPAQAEAAAPPEKPFKYNSNSTNYLNLPVGQNLDELAAKKAGAANAFQKELAQKLKEQKVKVTGISTLGAANAFQKELAQRLKNQKYKLNTNEKKNNTKKIGIAALSTVAAAANASTKAASNPSPSTIAAATTALSNAQTVLQKNPEAAAAVAPTVISAANAFQKQLSQRLKQQSNKVNANIAAAAAKAKSPVVSIAYEGEKPKTPAEMREKWMAMASTGNKQAGGSRRVNRRRGTHRR